ncbi:lipid A deacylase LpxR family protein [Roseomonas sp. OT10]|uniref:lipid A deacylase LpxR family protein n=1 Tax=Roseomonas cutis TaxID=2897332 RepID=UPI001E5632BC|nr:lipid A deacylase LpxR family protein [Roseomonas sp. OT10]UFN48563.1 lipid A deacylase LpxR family protein [Roseomonas sp. OT10]
MSGTGLRAAVLLVIAATPALAQQPPAAAPAYPPEPADTVSLTVENDLFGGGSDRHYTNGLLATWRPSGALPQPVDWANRNMGWLLGEGAPRWGLSLGQNIYTPQHTAYYVPDPNDRPYAGHLYGAFTLSRGTVAQQTLFEVQAGVVGPSALGEQVQNNWHRFLGIEVSRGWDHQLKDEFVLDVLAERRWRLPQQPLYGIPTEIIPEVAVSLGNASTYASAGAVLRIGTALETDWGPTRIRPALAGSGFFQPRQDFGWYAYVGLEGRAVARDIFLDGNTWRDGPSVDKRPLVGDLQLGIAGVWRGMRLAYTQVIRSEEFYGQRGIQSFGSINLSFRF